MWIHSKHAKQLALAHSELESLILERTTELQNLSQRLLQVQDEERRRVARDLHDTTGQTLAALKISVSFLQESSRKSRPDWRLFPMLRNWPIRRSEKSGRCRTCCIRRCWTK